MRIHSLLILFIMFTTFCRSQDCVVEPSVGGTVSGGVAVCSGTNTQELTLGGQVGTIQWQSSLTGGETDYVNITDATTPTLVVKDLISSTFYRAVVTNGACAAKMSTAVEVKVDVPSVSGTVSGGVAVCSGTNTQELTLGGQVGTIQWQSSLSGVAAEYVDISGATTSTLTVKDLSANAFYRAMVKSGVCEAVMSTVVEVKVDVPSVGGTVSGGVVVCSGTNSQELTLGGHVGSIQWQSSLSGVAAE
jgi:hypothetical protein